MEPPENNRFSGRVTVFHDLRLPEAAIPAGYSALIDAYALNAPFTRTLFAIGRRHRVVDGDRWRLLTPRHAPEPSLEGHLGFALKHEGLDLAVLKRLFVEIGNEPVEALVRSSPTGSYARRIWFLYEWLTGKELGLRGATAGSYVPVLDPKMQLPGTERRSRRHRVMNNLPGTEAFCPLVFRTETIEQYLRMNLAGEVGEIVDQIPRDVIARTASFLLLKDSRASYAIEGERPPRDRIERWGRAIGQAGRYPLDRDELLRLQRLVIGDARFVQLGFRERGGFVGEHDRETGRPLPAHISARADDVVPLVDGIISAEHGAASKLDPVIAAAVVAFGFIYAHPFEDGNGRIHRYLIHHILGERGFAPPGVVFPVSSAILERIDEYREVLRSYSDRLLPHIDWDETDDHNVSVQNDTADFYRYFDATLHAEFLSDCVRDTVDRHLPEEANLLRAYDRFYDRLQSIVDMPDRTVSLLFTFLNQNGGRLSKRAREKEFDALTADEVKKIEAMYAEIFGE